MFHVGFVAILRDSHRQRVYLRITKEILHWAPLRKLESLRGVISPLSQHPDALRRMDQTDGWKRWVWKQSVITLGYPLHFQSGRQPRGGLRMVGQSPCESRPMCANCIANCGVKVQGGACLFVTTAGTLVARSRQCGIVDWIVTDNEQNMSNDVRELNTPYWVAVAVIVFGELQRSRELYEGVFFVIHETINRL